MLDGAADFALCAAIVLIAVAGKLGGSALATNGKLRTTIKMDLAATQEQVQEIAMANEVVQKWMEGKPLKKFIFVKGKMVNIVI